MERTRTPCLKISQIEVSTMNKTLNIEVRGIGFPNKGAELMLMAICDKIQNRYPSAKICLPPNLPYLYRKNYPVYQIGKVVRFGFDFGLFLKFVPKKLREMFGVVMPSEINLILDASGFAYGDQWGDAKSRVPLAFEIKQFKQKDNNKVILLPQAFGPFTKGKLPEYMRDIIDYSDLVFARDDRSFEYLKGVRDSDKVKQAPDFTNQFQTQSNKFDYLSEYPICFIPNAKMLVMKSDSKPDSYVEFMARLLKSAHTAGHAPYLLIHEGAGDVSLAEKIKSLSGLDLPIVQPATAAEVKQAIAVSKLVVSSRFHGLVSALSQKIPVIATGWSHKYLALLQDYAMEDFIFDENHEVEKAEAKMLALLNSQEAYNEAVECITEHSDSEKLKTEDMWQQVFKVMDELND